MQLIPENLKRLTCTAFVHEAEITRIGREQIIRTAARHMAESALRKMIEDCIKTEGDYMGHPGDRLKLDVYVLTPDELDRLVAEARANGMHDAERWDMPNPGDLRTAHPEA